MLLVVCGLYLAECYTRDTNARFWPREFSEKKSSPTFFSGCCCGVAEFKSRSRILLDRFFLTCARLARIEKTTCVCRSFMVNFSWYCFYLYSRVNPFF